MGRDVVWTKEIVPNGGIDETRSPTQIEDHKWTTASNVEPLPDGVRTRQGINKSNSTALQSINIEEHSGTDDVEMYDSNSEYLAQQFTVGGSDLSVDTFAVRLKIYAGTPTDSIDGAIYTAGASNKPSAAVTGLDFSDCTAITAASLTSEYVWYKFVFDAKVTLSASTVYHLVIFQDTSAGTGTNTVSAECDLTGNPYSGGIANKSTDGSSWTNLNSTDLNFRIYSGSGAITGIYDYWLSDGTTQRHVVVHDSEVYKNSAGTMTAVSGRLRTPLTASANTFPSFAVGQDRLLIAHDSDTPQKFNIVSGVEYYSNQGISAPTATPGAAVVNAGGTLTDAHAFYVDYFYWNDDLGIKSNSWGDGTSAVTATTAAPNRTLRISNLPTTVAREGDLATHVRILLRDDTAGETVFTYQQQISFADLVTSGGVVDVLTRNIGTEGEYNHDLPPTHSINCVASNRQFMAGDPTYPWRVWYSLIVGAVPYYESVPTTNFRDFGRGDGDYVTALLFIPPRHVMVGTKNAIWIFDANQPGTSEAIRISRGIGIASQNAAIVVGRTVFFVSDGDRSKGMFVWKGGGEPEPVFGIDDTFKGLNQGRLQYASSAHYAPGDNRFQWWTLLSSASTHDTILVYDYALGSWTTYPVDANVIGAVETSSIEALYLGGYDGFERQADNGTQDDSTDITWSMSMKAFDFGTQEIRKRMRFADYVAAGKTTGSINMALDFDFGTGKQTSTTLTQIGDTSTGVWGTGTWGDGTTWGTSTANISGRVGLSGVGKFVQPSMNGSKPSHLKSIAFGVQGTGRR